MQRIALFRIREQPGPAVVEQDHVEFLRSIRLAGLTRSADERIISRQRLAGAAGREQRPQQREIFELRNQFLDADDGDVNFRERETETGIPFILGDGDHAGIRHGEVRAGNAHLGGEKGLPEFLPGDHRQLLRAGCRRYGERLRDVGFGQMHDRRDDVVGRLAPELADVFAEVGLDWLNAGLFESVVEMDLLGRHRFRFDGALHAAAVRQFDDVPARVCGGLGPEDLAAVLDDFALELFEIFVEVIDRLPLDLRGVGPGILPVAEPRLAFGDRDVVGADGFLDDAAMAEVTGLLRGGILELAGNAHVEANTSASEMVLAA